MKKFLIILILNILLIILLCIYFNDIEINNRYKIKIKVGDNLPSVEDYVKDSKKKVNNTKIEWKNIKIEDNKIYSSGQYKGILTYKKIKKNIILEVIDDEKPIINGVKDLRIFEGEELDLLKDISVEDNSHDDIKIEILGEYDLNKKGEYLLKYRALDKDNNETISDFKLIVEENFQSNTTSKGYKIECIDGIYYINGILIVNKSYGLPSTYKTDLNQDLINSFYTMRNDALKEGIDLYIISGFRSYIDQTIIYNDYVTRDGVGVADTYSARPGHSEHQSGYAIDINSLYYSFADTKEGKWIQDNAYKYGFIIRYPSGKEYITGYNYEPWHLRYVGNDLSLKLYNNGDWITIEEYFGISSKY